MTKDVDVETNYEVIPNPITQWDQDQSLSYYGPAILAPHEGPKAKRVYNCTGAS